MSNQAISLGVSAVNRSNQTVVEEKAKCLIHQIMANLKSVEAYKKSIAVEQESIKAIADDVVTQMTVIGSEFTPPLNPNQVTIANAIKKINDGAQESVSVRSQGHINRIRTYNATIENLNKQTAECRKQLNELSVEVVTESVVVGS